MRPTISNRNFSTFKVPAFGCDPIHNALDPFGPFWRWSHVASSGCIWPNPKNKCPTTRCSPSCPAPDAWLQEWVLVTCVRLRETMTNSVFHHKGSMGYTLPGPSPSTCFPWVALFGAFSQTTELLRSLRHANTSTMIRW